MSDYTVVQFFSTNAAKGFLVSEWMKEIWDSFSIYNMLDHGHNDYYGWQMTISELDLEGSIPILEKLKEDLQVKFIITYGVY